MNLYLYSSQDPINNFDLLGLLVQIHSRSVIGTKGAGAHTYITITDSGGNTSTYGSYQNKYDLNEVRKNDPTDHGHKRLPVTSSIDISPPEGMAPDEWDEAVISAAENRRFTQIQLYKIFGGDGGDLSGNCHTTTRGIIRDAGGFIPPDFDPPGLNPGLYPNRRSFLDKGPLDYW